MRSQFRTGQGLECPAARSDQTPRPGRSTARCGWRPPLLASALVVCLMGQVYGQRITARIVGTVTDPSGAAVPNVNITATNRGTGLTFKAASSPEGYYVLPQLPVGEYAMLVEVPGFRRLERAGIQLGIDQTVRVDLQLELGASAETVTITAAAPLLNSENVAQNTKLDDRQVTELPISFANNKQILDFMLLGAGVSSTSGPYGNANYSINGSPQRTQSASVDGTSIIVPSSDTWYLIRPSVEEVREIQVQSGVFSPEAGGLAAINIGTISGSNQFHGVGFFYYQNQDFAARNLFQAAVSPYNRKEGGGVLTGPVVKNRTFFAYSYDGFWNLYPQWGIFTVPTPQLKSGNFQGVGNIFDPATTKPNPNGPGYVREPFPGNQVPAARMDPVSLSLMKYWPDPNVPNALANNYNAALMTQESINFTQTIPSTSVKIDQKVADHNNFFARYQFLGGGYTQEHTFPGEGDYTGARVQAPSHIVTFGDTHIFSPRTLNEFRFGYFHQFQSLYTKEFNKDMPSKVGLKNVSALEFPRISIGGALSMVLGPRDGSSESGTERYQVSDSVTSIRGAHILKAGGNFTVGGYNLLDFGRPSGVFSFSGIFTNQPQVAGAAQGFADFLLGLPSSTSLSQGRRFGYRQPSFGLFLSDDIKLRRNLTMNLGVRFDRNWGVSEINNLASNFSPAAINPVTKTPGAVVFAGLDGAPTRFSNPTNRFSPRIGLAYTLRGSTVFRAGYSINYYNNPMYWLMPMTAGFVPAMSLVTTDQITPLVELRNGPPPLNTALNLNGGIANGLGVTWIPENTPAPAFYQWSFGIQRQLPGHMLLDAAYVGSRGEHLWLPINMNEVPTPLLGPGDAQSRRPFPQFQGISLKESIGFSKYHSLQMTLTRRMAKGLHFMVNYTISKATDNGVWDAGGGGAAYLTRYDLRREWALSDHDMPQTFNLTWMYEVPQWFGGRVGRYLAKGWQLNTIAHLYEGRPLNLGVSVNQTGSLGGTQRPDRIAKGTLPAGQRGLSRWFDPTAFKLPAPYTFGNSGRNVLRRPGFRQADFSVFKNTYIKTPLNESTNLQFRAEAYNVLNHPSLSAPNATIGSLAAGTITGASAARAITLGFRFVF